VWFDDYELVLGDSLRAKISDGLQHSRVGVVILSRNFFAKRWPQWELSALTARQLAGEENVILPVLHEIGHNDVRAYSPPLADLVAAKSSDGVEAVADGVVRVLKKRIAGGAPEAALAEARVPNRSPLGRTRWRLILGAFFVVGLLLLLVSVLTPERVDVPKVVGATISVATQRLQDEGFKVEPVRDNSVQPRNTVIGQKPGAGATADDSSTVTITVSDGPAIGDVPDVVGLQRNNARQKLATAGFKVRERTVTSESVKAGRVVAQSLPEGSLVGRGENVRIEVSIGPERLPVPDVIGKTEDEARAALDGFRVVAQDREDAKAEPGTVLAQKPAKGELRRGKTVILVVAIEPKPIKPKAIEPKQAAVPDVVGRSQNFATKILSGRGFEIAVEETAVDSPDKDGVVQKQSPGSRGVKLDRGSEVTITIGRFDPMAIP
jgi:beta-lactam-binding protein with PASTA domain